MLEGIYLQILVPDAFPFKESALMSTDLWLKVTDHEVMVHVVYDPEQTSEQEVLPFVKTLKRIGATVFLVSSNGLDCPLVSRIQR